LRQNALLGTGASTDHALHESARRCVVALEVASSCWVGPSGLCEQPRTLQGVFRAVLIDHVDDQADRRSAAESGWPMRKQS
jgi:hypothetical protein